MDQVSFTQQNQEIQFPNQNNFSNNLNQNAQLSSQNKAEKIKQPSNQKIIISQTQKSSQKNPIEQDLLLQKFQEFRSQYYNFFNDIIANPQNYVPQQPTSKDLEKHKIKYLKGNKFYESIQQYHEPYIRAKRTERQGTIVNYTVIIAIFELEITLLNIDQDAKKQQNKIGQGSFGSVRIESQNKRMFAVKRKMFKNKYHLRDIYMMANKSEINYTIIELAIYKICSLLKIGPAAETDIGFDLICYKDCIEFQIQYCLIIEYQQGIYVQKNKFKKQIKQCLLTLHFFRIIHKDIKPANIMFSIKYNKYVLADFGLSHPVVEKIGYRSITFLQGTADYMSDQMKKIVQGQNGYVDLYGNDAHSLSVVLKKQMINQNIKQGLKQFLKKRDKQHQNKEFEYEYLKLKYYCIKLNSKMEEVQTYWIQMDNDRLTQLIAIVDKSIEYDKIKIVYNYLSKQQKFKYLNLDNLRIQSQNIKSLNIDADIRQCTQLQLKNALRVYGYSLQVREMIIKLKLEQKYKETLKQIDKNMKKVKKVEYNERNEIFENSGKYIMSIRKQIQKYQNKKDYQNMFNHYLIILEYSNLAESEQIISKLKELKYQRTNQEKIKQIIIVNNAEKNKSKLNEFYLQMKNQNKQRDKIIDQLQLNDIVGSIFQYMSKYKMALDFYMRSLIQYEKKYGQKHPFIAARYFDLANIYENMSQYQKALQYYDKARELNQIFHGKHHPTVAVVYIKLADIQKNRGMYLKALKYYQNLNIINKKPLSIGVSYNSIGQIYFCLGDYNKAQEYFQKSIQTYNKYYKKEQPCYISPYNNIASVYQSKGQYKKAQNYFNKALNIAQSFYENQHHDMAAIYNLIACIYISTSQYQKSIDNYQRCIKILKLVYDGQQNISIIDAYDNIGMIYKIMGEYEKSFEYFSKCLEIYDRIFEGQETPRIANVYNNLGGLYISKGQYQDALSYCQKSLKIQEQFRGQKHPQIADIYNNIGMVYQKMGKYDIALDYYTKSLNIDIQLYGIQRPTIAIRYNNLGGVKRKMGYYEQALEYYNKSQKIDRKYCKQQHQNIANNYCNIGVVYGNMKKYKTALKYLKKSLKIDLAIHGQNHPRIANTYHNISTNYYCLKNFDSAHEYCYKSYKILTKYINSSQYQICFIYNILSNILLKKNKITNSLHYAYLALDTFLKCHKKLDHPLSPNLISSLAKIYLQMFCPIKSYLYSQLQYKILVRYFPIQNNDVIIARQNLNDLQYLMPYLGPNYTSNIQFIKEVGNKYYNLSKKNLMNMLFANKSQLNSKELILDESDSIKFLRCRIELLLCYKILGFKKQQSKITQQCLKEIDQLKNTQQKSLFMKFIKQI